MAGKTMEDMLVFHPAPGIFRHEGEFFAAIVIRGYIPKSFAKT
jgi:hypothetical protein